jgi:ferric-dicitrate binding protein FerR (iron transport regulator)
VGELRQVEGPVTLTRAGASAPAQPGPLRLQDVVETGEGARAQLRLRDGQVVELGPNSRFVLGEDQTGLMLELSRGFLISRIGAKGPAEQVLLSVRTPFGLTRLGSAESDVSFQVNPDGEKVSVQVGSIAVVSRNGAFIQASAGEEVALSEDGPALAQKPAVDMMLQPIQVTVRAQGQSRLQRKESKRWERLSGDVVLAVGDVVRVDKGRSVVALEGSRSSVELEAQSELALLASGRQGDVEALDLDFRKGAVRLNLTPGKRSRLTLSGFQLESQQGGQFGIRRTGSGIDVQALTGVLQVRQGGRTREVRANQLASLSTGQDATLQELPRPALVLPSQPGLEVFHPGLAQVTLSWPGEAGDYRVQVSDEKLFTRPFLDGAVKDPFLHVPAPRRGALYWRVLGRDGQPLHQGSATFSPERTSRDLAGVRNEVPAGREKTTIFYQDKPPAVTFTYPVEPGAARYQVTVFRMNELSRPVTEQVSTKGQLPLPAGTLKEGSYVWSVQPLSASGKPLRGGKMNKLELVYDNSVPSLHILMPLPGARAGATVQTRGVAPVGSRLAINGQEIDLDEKNRFDVQVSPAGSPPVLVYRLSRPSMPDAFTVRQLKGR